MQSPIRQFTLIRHNVNARFISIAVDAAELGSFDGSTEAVQA